MALMSGSSSDREDLTGPLINVETLTSFHCDAVVVVIAMTLNGKNIGVSAMLPWCGSTHEEARFDYRRRFTAASSGHERNCSACFPSVNMCR